MLRVCVCHGFFRGNWNVGRSYSLHGASGNSKKIVKNKVREVDIDHDSKLIVWGFIRTGLYTKRIFGYEPRQYINTKYHVTIRGILISSFWGGPRLFGQSPFYLPLRISDWNLQWRGAWTCIAQRCIGRLNRQSWCSWILGAAVF